MKRRWILVPVAAMGLLLGSACSKPDAPEPGKAGKEAPTKDNPPKGNPPEPAATGATGEATPGTSTTPDKKPTDRAAIALKPGEVEALHKALVTRLDARPKTCPRPVLRGDASAGDAEAAIQEAMTAVSAPACKAVMDVGKLEAGADLTPCGPAVEAVTRAATFESGCSPWRPGVRQQADIAAMPRLGRVLAERVRSLASSDGEANLAAAGTLALDATRVSQDAGRGANLLHAVAAGTIARPALDVMMELVDKADPATRTRWLAEVKALLATEPSLASVMDAEDLSVQLYLVAPPAMGADWKAPGELDPAAMSASPAYDVTGESRTDGGLLWAGYVRAAADVRKACPPDATDDACVAGLKALPMRKPPSGGLEAAFQALASADPADAVRDQIADLLGTVLLPNYQPIIEGLQKRRAALESLEKALGNE